MILPDPKALKELLKILRSQGVLQYNTTDLQLVLSETLPQNPRHQKSLLVEPQDGEPIEDMPTVEEIEAYINGTSVAGVPPLDE